MAANRAVQLATSASGARSDRLSGRQAWRLLWVASKPLSVGVLAWAALDAVDGPFVVGALGFVVGTPAPPLHPAPPEPGGPPPPANSARNRARPPSTSNPVREACGATARSVGA